MDNLKELKIKKRIYTRIMDVYREKNVYIPFFHPLIRFTLKLKIIKDFFIVNYLFRARPEEIVDWFQNKKIFFVFAVNRSGTTFLANFLSRVILDSLIEHEANVDDYWFYPLALRSEKAAEKYIRQFRLAEIYYRVKKKEIKLYGEINSFLRRHCQALQKALPNAKFFHLVRDGRKVVRSLMSRGSLGKIDPIAHLIKPPTDDPYVGQWESMTRFEKVCWLWQADNRYLRKSIDHTLQFEKIISDYRYFKTHLVDPIGIEISENIWSKYVHQIANPTKIHRMENWSEWSGFQKEVFRNICGEEMRACGYDFE